MKNIKKKIAAMLAVVTMMTAGAASALADYGDAEKDNGPEPRYKVGQYVEVYNTRFHASTTRCRILSAWMSLQGCWNYEIDQADLFNDVTRNVKIDADSIQSK